MVWRKDDGIQDMLSLSHGILDQNYGVSSLGIRDFLRLLYRPNESISAI